MVRLNQWINPIFDERLSQEDDVQLTVAPMRGDDASTWAALTHAHVYQISAAKDELPKQFWAKEELLSRCPDLLCVSAGGAGYDTVDVDACTRAGAAFDAGGDQAVDAEAVAHQFEHPQFLLLRLAVGGGDIAGQRIGGLAQIGGQDLA